MPRRESGSLPCELGSGRVSLATKCMTVVLPGGNFRAVQEKKANILIGLFFFKKKTTLG